MNVRRRTCTPIAAMASALALAVAPVAAQQTLSLAFSWAGTAACAPGPPAFRVGDVPAGTAALRFTMHDEQAPDYPHGGGTVRWTGNHVIPAGAFRYRGPCPPQGARHLYRWTVEALSGSGQVLATGSAERPFPPG